MPSLTTAVRAGAALVVFAIALLLIAGPEPASTAPPAAAAASATASAQSSLDDVTSVVVRARDGQSLDAIASFAAARGFGNGKRADSLHAIEFDLPPGRSLPFAIATLGVAPGAAYVEPVYTAFDIADNPADPLYSRELTYLNAIHAPAAWDIEQGQPETIVAILDTGIDLEHPDLVGRIWTNPGEIADNGVDDDANGCIDDVHGCAFVDAPSAGCDDAVNGDVSDDAGHGTFVAGIIAAANNSVGIVGIARDVTVMPVKMLDCQGRGDSLTLAKGVLYAAQAGAHVINVSLGGPSDALTMRDAVRVATEDYGSLIVAASGNTGTSGVAYPAKYSQVLAVGAASFGNPDVRAKFSTYGPEVDVVAVGERIVGPVPSGRCGIPPFRTCIGGDYASSEGTSFSTPQVAGLAALIVSRRPGITPASIIDLIKSTATAVPPGDKASWAGAGRINMLEALRPQFRLGVPGVAKN